MNVTDPQPEQRVLRAKGQLHQGECLLTWEWPRDVQHVYVYKFKPEEEEPADQLTTRHLKLITREEYKSTAGFRDTVASIGVRLYRIYPCVKTNGELTLLRQEDEDNLIRINGGRAQVRYSVKYGRSWFSKLKPVRMELFCEIDVPREALCYVKKSGAEPLNREDGVIYPFQSPFPAGQHKLPEIEIGKDEYVRVFLTDGKRFGDTYELIREK